MNIVVIMNFDWSVVRDKFGRILTHIVAMDALPYHSHWDQFEMRCIDRELNKVNSLSD